METGEAGGKNVLVELIIIVAIVWWVVKKKKDAANGGNPGNGAGPQITVTPANQQKENTDYFRKNTTPKSNAGTRNAVEEAKQDGHSTTAYLMEKAQADAKDKAAAEKFLSAIEGIVKELETPTLAEFGIDKEEFFKVIDKMAYDAMDSGSPQNTMREVSEEQVKQIYRNLW